MTQRFLVDRDPLTGMEQHMEFNDDGSTSVIVGSNVQAALDANKRCQGVNTEIRRGDQVWGHHVASIPPFLYWRWVRENPELLHNTRDAQVWLLNKLNSSEYCHLRTYDGKA